MLVKEADECLCDDQFIVVMIANTGDIKGSGIRGPLTEQLRRKENILESIRCTLFYCMLPWWHGNTFALLALCEENPTELPVMTSWRGNTFRIICLLWGKSTLLLLCCYHTPGQRSWGGYTGFTLSVRPSVRPSVRSFVRLCVDQIVSALHLAQY